VSLTAAATLLVVLSACGDSSEGAAAPKATYPDKAIEVIVPFDAGGFTDSSARVVVESLKAQLKQPVTVTNKAGAGGVTATTEFLRTKPDGYTIMALISGPTTEALAANPSLPYTWDSFTILGGIALSPRVLVAPVGGKFSTGQQLVDALKSDPAKVTWATGSPQGPATFSTLALFDQLGVDAKKPKRATFNGDGPAANAVAGGHVDFSAVNVSTALPLIKAGKLKPLVVSGTEKLSVLPDTPVAADLGLQEFVLDNWLGFMAPPETPASVVEAWGKALTALSTDADLTKKLEDMGSVSKLLTAQDLTDMVRKRFETSTALVQKFGAS
jgi:tripartite-type tricarboxylate transporter receptor subunit TctC